jgi:hypothetical protein
MSNREYGVIPKPYKFVNTTLKNGIDINSIVNDINGLLPQFTDFIHQFNNLVTQYEINVITDSAGNMSIDVPGSMSDAEANKLSTRVGIIDRLITHHGATLSDLFQKGSSLENKLKAENANYVSQLSDQLTEFKKLNSSYKHKVTW